MSLTRAQAATELGARAGRHLTTVGLTTVDSAGNLKEPLDDTFRALGVAYGAISSATVEESDLDRFLAVGEVFVLRQAVRAASGFADVAATTLGTSKRKSQIVANLKAALADAESAAAGYGVTALIPVMGAGVYTIDALEPEEVA